MLVDLFNEKNADANEPREPDTLLKTGQLRAGMVLSRDLVNQDGCLLLAHGHVLTESLVQQVRQFEQAEDVSLELYIRNSSIQVQK